MRKRTGRWCLLNDSDHCSQVVWGIGAFQIKMVYLLFCITFRQIMETNTEQENWGLFSSHISPGFPHCISMLSFPPWCCSWWSGPTFNTLCFLDIFFSFFLHFILILYATMLFPYRYFIYYNFSLIFNCCQRKHFFHCLESTMDISELDI